jgi:hypothetical protein
LPESEELRPELVEHALSRLAQANPRFREKLLRACVAAVEHDGKITIAESELLHAFAQSLDCPAPFPNAFFARVAPIIYALPPVCNSSSPLSGSSS